MARKQDLVELNQFVAAKEAAAKLKRVTPKPVAKLLRDKGGILLDVGCGAVKQPHFVGLDIMPHPCVDIIWDFERVPYPLPSESCLTILCTHVLEHINPANFGFVKVMDELWRLMKPFGRLLLVTPYAGSFGYWQDPTHCFASGTGVLTATGFKLLPEVQLNEPVLVLNPTTMQVELSSCIDKVDLDYSGPMYHFKHEGLMDLMVTPNHDLLWYGQEESHLIQGHVETGAKGGLVRSRADSFATDEGATKRFAVGASIDPSTWHATPVKAGLRYPPPTIEQYSGRVSCITVRHHHNILVSRHGKHLWAGNCNPISNATLTYFAPEHEGKLWYIYQPKPWRIIKSAWHSNGNIEAMMVKLPLDDKVVKDAKAKRKVFLTNLVTGKAT